MPDIVISELMDEAVVADLARSYDVLYDPTLVDRPADLAKALDGARALIVRHRTEVRGELLEAGARLKMIGRLGIGLDNIDLDACRARGIAVVPATGANDVAVAEWVIATTLALLRRAFVSTTAILNGDWPREEAIGCEAAGKVMGLVGFGGSAREVAVRAKALGMSVLAYDTYVPSADPAWSRAKQYGLEPLLRDADVVSLHVPLDSGTRNMLDALRISRMKRGAILLVGTRGSIVDEAAVVDALRRGHLGGAAFDVLEEEPLSPARAKLFAGIPNLILTPHVAALTRESNVRASQIIAESVRQHLAD